MAKQLIVAVFVLLAAAAPALAKRALPAVENVPELELLNTPDSGNSTKKPADFSGEGEINSFDLPGNGIVIGDSGLKLADGVRCYDKNGYPAPWKTLKEKDTVGYVLDEFGKVAQVWKLK
jgi:hypothetical protein